MSYELNDKCQLLATHCCACGKALCDAKSVELGIGPECGEHLHALDSLGEDQRLLANELTRAAAVYAHSGRVSEVLKCATALKAIGLTSLGELVAQRFKNAERLAKIFVAEAEGRLHFRTPKRISGGRDEWLRDLRNLPGRQWDSARCCNSIPATQEGKRNLWAFLRKHFEGAYGESDEGLFRVPTDKDAMDPSEFDISDNCSDPSPHFY